MAILNPWSRNQNVGDYLALTSKKKDWVNTTKSRKIFLKLFSTSQFNTSVPHKDHTFSTPRIPKFNTKNSLVQHQNPSVPHQRTPSVPLPRQFHFRLSSTQKLPQFHTENPPVQDLKPLQFHTKMFWFSVLNWGVFGVEPRGFWYGTEEVSA